MRPEVVHGAALINEPVEGRVPWMYLDRLGLCTTAVGCLIDMLHEALELPWQIGGYAATAQEIADDWHRVKASTDLARLGGGHPAWDKLTRCRLSPAGIDRAVARALEARAVQFRNRWPEFDTWPAAAQLLAVSLSWSVGAAGATGRASGRGNYPLFAAACERRDWAEAGRQCHIDDVGDSAVHRRNVEDLRLAAEAATVEAEGLDPDVLHWPGEVVLPCAPTQPEGILFVPDTLTHDPDGEP